MRRKRERLLCNITHFKLFDLLYFWTGRIISTIVLGALYGGLLAFIIGSFLGYYTQSFGLGGGLIGIIGNIIFNYYGIKHQIKKIEIEESEFETPEMEKERIKRQNGSLHFVSND